MTDLTIRPATVSGPRTTPPAGTGMRSAARTHSGHSSRELLLVEMLQDADPADLI